MFFLYLKNLGNTTGKAGLIEPKPYLEDSAKFSIVLDGPVFTSTDFAAVIILIPVSSTLTASVV
jgi:hypothetical protein